MGNSAELGQVLALCLPMPDSELSPVHIHTCFILRMLTETGAVTSSLPQQTKAEHSGFSSVITVCPRHRLQRRALSHCEL